jgi:hypothetical protein
VIASEVPIVVPPVVVVPEVPFIPTVPTTNLPLDQAIQSLIQGTPEQVAVVKEAVVDTIQSITMITTSAIQITPPVTETVATSNTTSAPADTSLSTNSNTSSSKSDHKKDKKNNDISTIPVATDTNKTKPLGQCK